MKKKSPPKFLQKKPNLIRQLVNPRYIPITGKYDPLILKHLKRIIDQSS